MNVGQLKVLLKDLDDDTEIVNTLCIEQGRGSCGGVDFYPSIEVHEPDEMEFYYDDENRPTEDHEFYKKVDEGEYTNKVRVLVISGDIEEEWCQ